MEIQIRTVVFGCSFGGGDASTVVEVPDKGATLRTLIEKKVEQEVAAFNRNRHLLYGREYRTPEEMIEDGEAAADPSLHGTYEPVAWEPEAARAVQAWKEGTFRITLDDRKAAELDGSISLTPELDVVFLRLMPFISG